MKLESSGCGAFTAQLTDGTGCQILQISFSNSYMLPADSDLSIKKSTSHPTQDLKQTRKWVAPFFGEFYTKIDFLMP